MPVKELIVELSRNCNLSCIMCGFGGNEVKSEWFMARELLEKVLNEMGEGLEVIRLNGRGESAIHPEFIELLNLTHSRCPQSSIHLFTNLSWDRPDLINRFIEVGVQLFISIDSPDPALLAEIRRGCRPEQIELNLLALKSINPRPFMVATLQERNLHQITDIAAYAVQHRCHLLFNTVRYDEGASELEAMINESQRRIATDFEAATTMMAEYGLRCHFPDQMHGIDLGQEQRTATTGGGDAVCPALHQELFVTYAGKVQPCNMFHPYVLGDLKFQALDALRSGSRWSWFESNHFESDYCLNCAHMRPEV